MTQGWFRSCGRKAIGVASVDWRVERLGDPRERSRAVQGAREVSRCSRAKQGAREILVFPDEVSGLEASSYHVPMLKGEAGFYVRSLISSNDEPLTEYVLAMHRIRMIRARILGHKTRGWAIQYWTSASHVLKVHVTSVLSAFQLGFF